MTGMELRLRRVASRIQSKQLAAAMGVADSRVSQIEALAIVTPAVEVRYIAALDQCIASTKDRRPAEASA